MNKLDTKYLNREHLQWIKAGTRLWVKSTHQIHTRVIIYRGYRFDMNSNLIDRRIVIRLLFERVDDKVAMHYVCQSMQAYGDYFSLNMHSEGERLEIIKLEEPDFTVPLMITTKYWHKVPILEYDAIMAKKSSLRT